MNESAKDSEGLPVSLQVIGHSHEDEKVLGVMKVLEQAINYEMKVPEIVQEGNQFRLIDGKERNSRNTYKPEDADKVLEDGFATEAGL